MSGLRKTCHCGCDEASHYLDRTVVPAERCACLSCGDCTRYVNEDEPKPALGRGERPRHAPWCQCARCKEFSPPGPPTIKTPTDGLFGTNPDDLFI